MKAYELQAIRTLVAKAYAENGVLRFDYGENACLMSQDAFTNMCEDEGYNYECELLSDGFYSRYVVIDRLKIFTILTTAQMTKRDREELTF